MSVNAPVEIVGPRRRGVTALVLRLRFTLLIGAVVLALQFSFSGTRIHGRAVRALGTNWHTLATGHVWRLVTGVLTQDQPGVRWSILIPFLWVGVAEWSLGWRRTAMAFFLCDWLSTVPVLVVLRVAASHSLWAAQQIVRFDCGSSSAIFGTLAAFCASRRGPNAWVAPVLLAQTMVTIWLTNHRLSDVQHLAAIAVGLMLGLVIRLRGTRSTRSSTATTVAV